MSKLVVNGANKLEGEIFVHGAKNSALPILAATLLCEGESVLNNCPQLTDVKATVDILKILGCNVQANGNTLKITAGGEYHTQIPKRLMCEMRSSVIFLSVMLSRFGEAVITNPGGCNLGPRPIDLHIMALKSLGAEFTYIDDKIICKVPKGLNGAKIHFPFVSVGATENAILAAVLTKGKTVIYGAAKEPEICDLVGFLNKCGADIKGAGSSVIEIEGVSKLSGCEYTIIPDRIVAATYLSAAAITGGSALVNGCIPEHFSAFTEFLKQLGCEIAVNDTAVYIEAPPKLVAVNRLTTGVYPAFPTDAGPLAVALLSVARGKSEFYETVFPKRFQYTDELKVLGADIDVAEGLARITGSTGLIGNSLYCPDLRAGAALVIAALASQGRSELEGVSFIDRGYENIENNLQRLSADIIRI